MQACKAAREAVKTAGGSAEEEELAVAATTKRYAICQAAFEEAKKAGASDEAARQAAHEAVAKHASEEEMNEEDVRSTIKTSKTAGSSRAASEKLKALPKQGTDQKSICEVIFCGLKL